MWPKVKSIISSCHYKLNLHDSQMHDGKNDFIKILKNLVIYRAKDNFVESSKLLCMTLKYEEQCYKNFNI